MFLWSRVVDYNIHRCVCVEMCQLFSIMYLFRLFIQTLRQSGILCSSSSFYLFFLRVAERKSLMAANSSRNSSRWTRNTSQMALGCTLPTFLLSHSRKVGRKQREFGFGDFKGLLDYEAARFNTEPVVLKGHERPETGPVSVHQPLAHT